MLLKEVLEVFEVIDSPKVCGESIKSLLKPYGIDVKVQKVEGDKGFTEFVSFKIVGSEGRTKGGNAKTLGIIGRLGGIGARPSRIGMVSDADGCVAAIAAGLKLAKMSKLGDVLKGDVIISTHICPDAPTQPHFPVDFMDSPVDILTMNRYEVADEMEAVLSIDTTKGNRIINHKGISISPTVKEGYILKVSDDLIRVIEMSTGNSAHTFPVTMQDITPYGNDLYHINSILQPSVATKSPVVGVAITTVSSVAGCGTGASHEVDVASASNFSIEVAKEYGEGKLSFYDEDEFSRIEKLYGKMNILQTLGKE